jgi:hypothetical protein
MVTHLATVSTSVEAVEQPLPVSRQMSGPVPGHDIGHAPDIASANGFLWPVVLLAAAVITAAMVLWIGHTDPAARARRVGDADLLMLLRLMAGIKAGAALGLLWLAAWRLRRPASPSLALGLVGAVMLMVSGPALLWNMFAIGFGALTFYGGLAALCLLLWRDRATILARLGVLGGAGQ